ncbi:MAG: PAS domain-containing protein [Betaproteobacteria bacterium]|nr:PAS domain-containing protein [Betaproteobacteria bacterium]
MNKAAGWSEYNGLDLLATAVLLLDSELRVRYINAAAESLFGFGLRSVSGQRIGELFPGAPELETKLAQSIGDDRGFSDQDLVLTRAAHEPLHLNCIATPFDGPERGVLLELRHIDQQLRIEREEQRLTQHQANRELIRNLAHEIKNPLGGLRGSAQLLERELDRPELREYTQVIIKEADRLQSLMDRLLTPHRLPHRARLNIHEVCERVRTLILAEFPGGIRISRDYDTSLPELDGDREQLIQAVLNIVRNAAQALQSERNSAVGAASRDSGQIVIRTRIGRQVTLARHRYRLALELQVVDNGPGIPEDIRDRIFYPLVSGREGGSGLGLTLAQTFVQHHHGVIECESRPGCTDFRIVLPLI